MKVDYHVHLEEGPYSISFVQENLETFEQLYPSTVKKHSKEWIELMMSRLNKRLDEGEYSEWWLDFYLQQAINKGIKEVGIVDHLYRFKETKAYFTKHIDVTSPEIGQIQKDWLEKVMVRSMDDFVEFIIKMKSKWAKKGVQLKLGIEADYFIGGEEELQAILDKYKFDYIIGSIHFYDGWGFDNPEAVHKFSDYHLSNLYEDHFRTVMKAVDSGLFDIIAHLDNIKVFNYRPEESSLINLYRAVAKKLKDKDVATEINPGLYYRYPVKEMCPSPTFLGILAEEGVLFTTSSDGHYPNHLGIYSEEIRSLLTENGITEIVSFTDRNRIVHKMNDELVK